MRPVSWVLVGLVSCSIASTREGATAKRPPPTSEITFHVDKDFTIRERRLLREASAEIDRQTGHHVQVHFLYDLDYSTPEGRPPLDQWYLSRLDSIQVLYQTRSDSVFLGLTIPRLKQTILVYDRLGADAQFEHTAIHEFMHAFGVPHLPCDADETNELAPAWCQAWAKGRVMGPRATWEDGEDAPLCLNAADADAFARVTHQPRADFLSCL